MTSCFYDERKLEGQIMGENEGMSGICALVLERLENLNPNTVFFYLNLFMNDEFFLKKENLSHKEVSKPQEVRTPINSACRMGLVELRESASLSSRRSSM